MIKLNNELSDFIKLERYKAKLSQEDMANKIKISRNTYTTWENNPKSLNLEQLSKIGKALDIDIFIFFNNYVAKSNKD